LGLVAEEFRENKLASGDSAVMLGGSGGGPEKMSKYGIIFVSYNSADMLPESLPVWLKVRQTGVDGHSLLICAVSCPFEGFNEPRSDDTLGILERARAAGNIDHLILSEIPIKETEARGRALTWLMQNGCDTTWMVDADEFHTIEEIQRIVKFVEARPGIVAFRGSLRNCVFTPNQYLAEPFNPMRIHRLRVADLTARGFWDDNNVWYERDGAMGGTIYRDTELPTLTIPKTRPSPGR